MKTNKPPVETLTLDRAGAARLAGISLSRLRDALNSGQLRAKKYGNRTIIRRADVERFIAELPDYAIQKKSPD